MSTNPQEIIDLTGDGNGPPSRRLNLSFGSRPSSLLPRTPPTQLAHDVISLDDHDDVVGGHVSTGSPELEFMFSRTLLPTTMPHSRPHGAGPPGAGMSGSPPTGSLSSFSQMTGTSWAEWRNQGQRRHRFDANPMTEELYRQHRQRNRPQEARPRPLQGLTARMVGELFTSDRMFVNANPDMDLPDQLNFIAQGFAMGPVGQGQGDAHARLPPTYDPPSPPRAGYTRDPKEEDILLCPNCEEELGVGKDDIKRQVWVIKKCGHVWLTILFSCTRKLNQD